MTNQLPDATKMVLSPAAQAVLRAAGDSEPGIYATIAAALRTAVDRVVPEPDAFISPGTANQIRSQFLALAAELEGATP